MLRNGQCSTSRADRTVFNIIPTIAILIAFMLCAFAQPASAAAAPEALMISPTSGSQLPSGPVDFTWTPGSGVTEVWLWVGSTTGGQDLYVNGGAGSTGATAPALTTSSGTVYARLWSCIGGAWLYDDYVYTTSTVAAVMSSPGIGSTLSSGSNTFTWTAGTGVSQTWLWVGSSVGGSDLYVNGGTGVYSATATNLPANGSTIYVRLWSFTGAAWLYHDYTYTAANAMAVMTSPMSGIPLPSGPVTFSWTAGTGVAQAWLWVGSTAGGNDLYVNGGANVTSATATNLPANGSTIYVRLWSFTTGGAWLFHDYTYTASNSLAGMVTPAPGTTLQGSSVTFNWTPGTGVNQTWLWLGSTQGGQNLYVNGGANVTTATATNLPTNGSPLYARLWSLTTDGAWLYRDYTYTTGSAVPTLVTVVSGSGQNADVRTAFANPLVVAVKDSSNNPVAGVTVSFFAPMSGASSTLSMTSVLTDSNGLASVSASANATAGQYNVTASVVGVPTPATFNLTNIANAFNILGYVQLGYNSGLNGVTVNLYDSGMNQVQSVITGSCGEEQSAPGGNGCFTFTSVPKGNYTITPPSPSNIPGATAVFSPANIAVTVAGSDLYREGFQASVGYTVTGSVTYSNSQSGKTGMIYITLQPSGNSACNSFPYGTAISSPGTFTIRGVCPGTFTLSAWMDTVGLGYANASDPITSATSVTIPSSGSLAAIDLGDSTNAFNGMTGPALQFLAPVSNGVMMQIKPVTNSNGVEMPSRYHIQWSIDNTFASVNGEKIVAADNGDQPYILGSSEFGSLADGANPNLWFRIRGENSKTPLKTTLWTTTSSSVNIGALTPSDPVIVTGNVNYSGTATGPLYVGCYDQNTNNIYGKNLGIPSSFPVSYSVSAENGANCFMFAFLDNNSNGYIDAGDISNTDKGGSLILSGSLVPQDITLPSGNAIATVSTNVSCPSSGCSANQSWYGLGFDLEPVSKKPMVVTLVDGPYLLTPTDIANGNNGKSFGFWPSLGNQAPSGSDTYHLQVTYNDGTTDAQPLAATETGLLGASAFARNLTVDTTTTPATSTKPTFNWQPPLAPPANYGYSFSIQPSNGGNNIWQVPSNSYDFSSSITSLVWGVDPVPGDNNNTPNPSSLTVGSTYNWSVTVYDGNGNSAQAQAEPYTPQ
jgi:hypothetical protein